MPKSIQTNATFQNVPKTEKLSPRCDFELKRVERVLLEWSVYGSQGPQRAAHSSRTRQKKEGERQKERRSKKERVRGNKGERGI